MKFVEMRHIFTQSMRGHNTLNLYIAWHIVNIVLSLNYVIFIFVKNGNVLRAAGKATVIVQMDSLILWLDYHEYLKPFSIRLQATYSISNSFHFSPPIKYVLNILFGI